MKDIKDIFELIDGILYSKAKKTVFFCEVEESAYEIFYYVYFEDDSCKQCYELVEEGKVDEGILDAEFEKLAGFIRKTDVFDAGKRNVVTLFVEGMKESVSVDQFDKSVGLYNIKKDWKLKHICGN